MWAHGAQCGHRGVSSNQACQASSGYPKRGVVSGAGQVAPPGQAQGGAGGKGACCLGQQQRPQAQASGTKPKPTARPLTKGKGIGPSMHLGGGAAREAPSPRALGHRGNFGLSGRAPLGHADKVVSSSLWAARWVRGDLGPNHALGYAAPRVAPSALFAVGAGATPVGYEALGGRVARAALGLEPPAGQKLPPNWCPQTTPKWVPWGCEVSLRFARLEWPLEKAGSTTPPGRLHKLCFGETLGEVPLQFRSFACSLLRWSAQPSRGGGWCKARRGWLGP